MSEPLVRGAIVNELALAARYAIQISNAELRASGVDPAEYGLLSFIGVLQPVTRTNLAEATGENRTTQRDGLRRRIEQGHIREVPNPRDGRSTLLELTPAGQAIFEAGMPAFQRALRRIDGALEGGLREHEEAIRRVRLALASIVEGSPTLEDTTLAS
jgi:DNA-binding MarR family transcriptional regulator